jgi:hypothetical protein
MRASLSSLGWPLIHGLYCRGGPARLVHERHVKDCRGVVTGVKPK